MAKLWLSAVVLLSLGACVPGEYGYTTSTSSYTPDYASDYPPAYAYGYAEPAYPAPPPPFWGNGLELGFGGGRRHHHGHHGSDWDRGD